MPPPATDQRGSGFARVVAGRVDVGAFELGIGEISVDLIAGELSVGGSVIADDLSIARVGSDLVVSSLGSVGVTTSTPGTVQIIGGGSSASIPFAAITGGLAAAAGGGDDSLAFDFAGGSPIPPGGIVFDGEVGDDSLALGGATVGSVNHTFVNASDGIVAIDGQSITYLGLAPVDDDLGAADRSFVFTGGDETITLSENDGLNVIDSTLGEVVTFPSPTNSVSIDAGSGIDDVVVDGIAPGFPASLSIVSEAISFTEGARIVTGGEQTYDAAQTLLGVAPTTGSGILLSAPRVTFTALVALCRFQISHLTPGFRSPVVSILVVTWVVVESPLLSL